MSFPGDWHAIGAMLTESPSTFLVRHQLDSFDDFINNKLRCIIEGFNPLDIHFNWLEKEADYEVKVSLTMSNPVITRPMATERDGSTHIMTPTMARDRGFTYGGVLHVDVKITSKTLSNKEGEETVYVSDEKTLKGVSLGLVPIMVKSTYCIWNDPVIYGCSGECWSDPGGYFIVGGTERVVVSQDRMPENRPFVYATSRTANYTHAAEVRSLVSRQFGVPKITTLRISAKPNPAGRYIHVSMHHVNVNVPLFILFRVFGLRSDEEIFDAMHGGSPDGHYVAEELGGCAYECHRLGIYDRPSAMRYLMGNTSLTGVPREYCNDEAFKYAALERMLRTEVMPHVGPDPAKKALYLASLARSLLLVAIGVRAPDDRDSYVCKRINAPGTLLANLTRQYYGKLVKEIRRATLRELLQGSWRQDGRPLTCVKASNIDKIIKTSTLESGLKAALMTGNWGIKTGATQGVSQVLNRITYCATLSHLRRVSTNIDKNSKLIQPRKLHGTQWGIFCPAETPEGHNVGFVKNMAVGAMVTVASDTVLLEQIVASVITVDPVARIPRGGVLVLLNYVVVGSTLDGAGVVGELRRRKLEGVIHPHTAIVWDIVAREIRVSTDGGRMVRPFYRLRANGDVPTVPAGAKWHDLITDGTIEYLDVEEASFAFVAFARESIAPGKTDFMEIHPSLVLGVLASCIPFPDHNQSPRNSYQSAMGKQAVGLHTRFFRHRMDTGVHVMDYGQRPIASSRVADMMGCSEMPSGINVVVAISTLGGYNQEDAVILNRTSAERGMFTSTYYNTLKETLQKNTITGEEEQFYLPSEEQVVDKSYDYSKVTETGFPRLGAEVRANDVVIAKYMPNRGEEERDTSYALKTNEHGTVDRIIAKGANNETVNGDGYSFCKLRLREHRTPMIGDKFSSRSGQKGTVGMLVAAHDMPYTSTGLVPDIVMNPHALPSRMTVGMLLESILGKACCVTAQIGNATPFDGTDYDDIADRLAACGMERNGDEVMYDPRSGRQTDTAVSVTVAIYQRLKHIVADKVHGRGRCGPLASLTRQPAEGRARDGGLRLGEMENECLWAHGTSGFLKERFSECSDGFPVFVCGGCSAIATVNPGRELYKCSACSNTTNFKQTIVPYAFKLLGQEVNSLGIAMSSKMGNAMTKWQAHVRAGAQK
jgi:DNA-directed RNA polymerase II subunit RPB2